MVLLRGVFIIIIYFFSQESNMQWKDEVDVECWSWWEWFVSVDNLKRTQLVRIFCLRDAIFRPKFLRLKTNTVSLPKMLVFHRYPKCFRCLVECSLVQVKFTYLLITCRFPLTAFTVLFPFSQFYSQSVLYLYSELDQRSY